jgi:hypothetical protein
LAEGRPAIDACIVALHAALPRAGGTAVGEAVLLALENDPELALPLIRKALLANIPTNRSQTAALLALMAKPWSRRELLRALEASADQEQTADARAPLLESGDEEARHSRMPADGHAGERRDLSPPLSTAPKRARGRSMAFIAWA